MKIVMRKVGSLRPWEGNPRIMSRHDMEALKSSITAFGFVEPLVINKAGLVIGGHQRLEAAKALKLKEVPVVIITVSSEQEKILCIALNRVHGEWDWKILQDLLTDMEPDLHALTGFDEQELSRLLTDMDHPITPSSGERGIDFNAKNILEHTCPRCGFEF